VDDRLGDGLEHRLSHSASIEEIESNRSCAECADAPAAAGGGMGADDLMAGIDQLRNEAAANRTARPCNENSHRLSPFGHIRGCSRVLLV